MDEYKKGIEYRPNIYYDLGKVPPNKYRELIINSNNYITSQDLEGKTDNLSLDIDFLIVKAEERLKKVEEKAELFS